MNKLDRIGWGLASSACVGIGAALMAWGVLFEVPVWIVLAWVMRVAAVASGLTLTCFGLEMYWELAASRRGGSHGGIEDDTEGSFE